MMNLTTACWVIKMVNARNIGGSNHQVSAYAAEPGLYGVSRSKRLVRSLLMPTSLLGLARTNDCAQHSHLSAANRAIFIASIICVTVQHSKIENRGILPEMSNCYCHPGKAGESPHPLVDKSDVSDHTQQMRA
jgi:hypothetical protein